MNSKTSPGNTSSASDPDMSDSELIEMLSGLVHAVMNRDAVKHIGARNTFIVSSARRNFLMLGKSS